MSKETDAYFRRGAKYGFKIGWNSAVHEMRDLANSAIYDRHEKRIDRKVHHMKDIEFNSGMMSYYCSKRRIK